MSRKTKIEAPMPPRVTTKMIGLAGIAVSDRRLRKIRPETVDELAEIDPATRAAASDSVAAALAQRQRIHPDRRPASPGSGAQAAQAKTRAGSHPRRDCRRPGCQRRVAGRDRREISCAPIFRRSSAPCTLRGARSCTSWSTRKLYMVVTGKGCGAKNQDLKMRT